MAPRWSSTRSKGVGEVMAIAGLLEVAAEDGRVECSSMLAPDRVNEGERAGTARWKQRTQRVKQGTWRAAQVVSGEGTDGRGRVPTGGIRPDRERAVEMAGDIDLRRA